MSKSEGKKFEEDFADSVPDYMYCHRVRDSMYYKGAFSIADFLVYFYPYFMMLELKSQKGISCSFSRFNEDQLEELEKKDNIDGIRAGIVFNFRQDEETYYLPIDYVNKYIEHDEEFKEYYDKNYKSIPLDWCREYGVKINQSIRRTRYDYDFAKFWEELTMNG